MRSIGIIILTSVILAVFTRAEVLPPRIMQIHLKDGSIDSLYCDQIDPAYGIMFEGSEMKVTFLLVDSALMPIPTAFDETGAGIPESFKRDVRYYLPSLIDSITFPLVQ